MKGRWDSGLRYTRVGFPVSTQNFVMGRGEFTFLILRLLPSVNDCGQYGSTMEELYILLALVGMTVCPKSIALEMLSGLCSTNHHGIDL